LIYISVGQISKEFIVIFVDDLIKAIDVLYSVYCRLLNFELGCFDIGLVGFINFLGFYRAESLVITVVTMFGAEVARNVLNDENVVYIVGSR